MSCGFPWEIQTLQIPLLFYLILKDSHSFWPTNNLFYNRCSSSFWQTVIRPQGLTHPWLRKSCAHWLLFCPNFSFLGRSWLSSYLWVTVLEGYLAECVSSCSPLEVPGPSLPCFNILSPQLAVLQSGFMSPVIPLTTLSSWASHKLCKHEGADFPPDMQLVFSSGCLSHLRGWELRSLSCLRSANLTGGCWSWRILLS